MNEGSIDRREGTRSLRALTAVRQEARSLTNRHGRLGRRDESRMMAKLDDIATELRSMRHDDTRRN